jgi:TetR/AcrR family transcriptional regulator, mexJK operon transcriptional repressor
MSIVRKKSVRQLEKQQQILNAALKVFSEFGFSAASMDAIALAAEVSKPTLYMYFGSKEQLFESMMVAERDVMLEPFEHSSGEMVSDLVDFAWQYADVVMRPEYLSLARLIIGEAQRFPDIGRAYQKAGPDRLLFGIIAYLEMQKAKRRLDFDEGELAAQDFWALILSAPRNQALHIPDQTPSTAQIARYLENGLKVFIKAYSTQPEEDLRRLNEVIISNRGKHHARKST